MLGQAQVGAGGSWVAQVVFWGHPESCAHPNTREELCVEATAAQPTQDDQRERDDQGRRERQTGLPGRHPIMKVIPILSSEKFKFREAPGETQAGSTGASISSPVTVPRATPPQWHAAGHLGKAVTSKGEAHSRGAWLLRSGPPQLTCRMGLTRATAATMLTGKQEEGLPRGQRTPPSQTCMNLLFIRPCWIFHLYLKNKK